MTDPTSNKKFEEAFEPVIAFNKLLAETAEAAYNLQMESYQTFAKISMSNVNAGLQVHDLVSMIAYVEKQKANLQKANERILADTEALADLNAKFLESARNLART